MRRIIPIIMGSEKDYDFAERIGNKLEGFSGKYSVELPFEYRVSSAHKTPSTVTSIVGHYDSNFDCVVYETVAGRSNALSAMIVGETRYPVIACPPDDDKDALQMDI